MPTSRQDIQLTAGTVAAVLAIGGATASAVDPHSVVLGGHSAMLWCAALALVIQIAAWIPASIKQTETYFDLTGGLTYIGLVVLSLWIGGRESFPSAREWLLSAMVIIWATRLASFLFLSIQRAGKDQRFDDLKTSAVRFLVP